MSPSSSAGERAAFSYRGSFDARVGLLHLPASQISGLLPHGVDLMPARDIPALLRAPLGQHPVLFFAGNHHDVRSDPHIYGLPQDLDYLEIAASP